MTENEAYKVHIQYTFNAFCKIVIRHAAIDKILKLRRRWEREVSLDYLMSEKFVQLSEPEQLEEYLFTACGQTAVLYHAELAAALALLPEQTQEEIFRYSRKYLAQHEAELADYRAAKATMSDLLGGAKLPKMDTLKKERRALSEKKKALYAEYRKAQADMRQAVAVKANIDHLLGHTDERENKAQER